VSRDAPNNSREGVAVPEEQYSPVLFARNLQEWRGWLEKNCATEKRVYLVIFRKTSGIESVGWHEAIEHALCYGWVDSVAHKRDGSSCYLKFTPRNPASRWGKRNIERAKKMTSLGFMREPGLSLIDAARSKGNWIEET
jgi:uncharacterized protein YdeI (YjbR/CyaY-like superfamily)